MKNELLQDLETRFETLNHIRNLAQNYDENLLEYLLETSIYKNEFKSRFFIARKKAFIFKLNDFLTFLDLRNLSGSFTSYTNKIGLGFKTKSFLKTNNEVVLNFAYKDGVIKGGQSKDEKQKSKEIFFNEILAKDEIDVLFAPKALQNFELVGNSACTAISAELESQTNKRERERERDNEQLKNSLNAGANLLIKGNNLLALHSLKKKFANKVKLIYIDPPYNTGNDSFNYNDNFNHSTWLTFMKNRLEIAREFLRDDGVIFIQCDDNEQAYLKVLCDEIFGRDNFVATICWRKKTGGGQDSIYFAKEHEYILCYQKQKWQIIDSTQEQNEKDFSKIINGKKAKILKLEKWGNHSLRTDRPTLYYAIKDPNGNDFYPVAPNGADGCWRKKPENLDKEHIFWQEDSKGRLTPYEVIYFDEVKHIDKILKTRTMWLENGNTTQATNEIKALFENDNTTLFATPKPEALIKRIIEISTQENDLVMDFFAGSGTTLAVAMKMKRQFIGIEQMDYIESITKERLKKVVSGEQGGISKAVDWQGGGSFIYAELMPLNVAYKERIKNINDEKELEKLYNDLESKAFLDYRIDLAEILKDKEFKDLDLQNKQEALLKILDSNMDYVLYGDIEDKDYAISSEVIELNKIFYGDCHDFANANSRNDKKGK
ncbi:site-specific DNA-methyltransferase [Campylobacter upsaliensis]|uniref:site-specific DNA-methyltransferase n=1 Tax=Campylobacter upsaliensis TaxID=28080 RepID=UPI002B3A52B2|nr:site-specific DNA-methyltransferase [Campylobacter upsaliensis]MEB2788864.1 site-specific DNA-methyltransferase [Campylobacter upsaliensis]MEB2797933.1 site-specific DNA-methyltransferase [Campylobacter upsaliensis]